jgi:AraC family transcriptional regulator
MRSASRQPALTRVPSSPLVTSREAGGFVLEEALYRPGFRGEKHRHAKSYLAYIVAGDFTESCGSGRSRYGRGSLHFHPSDDPHEGVVGESGARCFTIKPSAAISARLDTDLGALRHQEWPGHVASLAARCHRAFLARDSAWDLDCEGSALELLAALLRRGAPGESRAPRWLFVARDHLHAHAPESVTLSQLAAISGVDPVHLTRTFRRCFGVTPADYVRRLRLEIACRALAETDQSIAEVALEAGYSSQAHLTRAFRARLGSTPARYRRARRSKPV